MTTHHVGDDCPGGHEIKRVQSTDNKTVATGGHREEPPLASAATLKAVVGIVTEGDWPEEVLRCQEAHDCGCVAWVVSKFGAQLAEKDATIGALMEALGRMVAMLDERPAGIHPEAQAEYVAAVRALADLPAATQSYLERVRAMEAALAEIREIVSGGHTEWAAWNIPQCGCFNCSLYRAAFPEKNLARALSGQPEGDTE